MPENQAATSANAASRQTAWHEKEVAEVFCLLDSSEKGLPRQQSVDRLSDYGPNRLPAGKRRSLWQRFLSQCHKVLIYVLLVVSSILWLVEMEEWGLRKKRQA